MALDAIQAQLAGVQVDDRFLQQKLKRLSAQAAGAGSLSATEVQAELARAMQAFGRGALEEANRHLNQAQRLLER